MAQDGGAVAEATMNDGTRAEVAGLGGETASEELAWYRHALDQSAIVAVTDVRGVILHVNDRFCEISGYGRDELVEQGCRNADGLE